MKKSLAIFSIVSLLVLTVTPAFAVTLVYAEVNPLDTIV